MVNCFHRGTDGAPRFYKVPKAPKLIYAVILWYSFVVQSPPPPPPGGEPSLHDCPPDRDRPDQRGQIARTGGIVCGGWLGLLLVASGRELGLHLPSSGKKVGWCVPTSGDYERRTFFFLPLVLFFSTSPA